MPRRKILRHGQEDNSSHRSDFETCPHCAHEMSWEQWGKRDSILILEPRYAKAGYAAVMSECQKCFELSWVHRRFRDIESPSSWAKAAEKESASLHLAAIRKFGKSLCWRCKQLESATIEHHAWVHCQEGCRSGPTKTSCVIFVPISEEKPNA